MVMATAALGLMVGWPSSRLFGDYLAIVTLFFGEAFVEFTNNVAPAKLGGPNGIVGIDPISSSASAHQQQRVLPAAGAARGHHGGAAAARHLPHRPRLARGQGGSAGARAMTIPVNRVKLMAFAFGAMVAALAGTIFAAQQISVFPTDFDTPILILVYAGLILGGAGSIAGAAPAPC